MSRDTERFFEVATMIGQRMGSAAKEFIPPEAQVHLLNAQRELLTALFLIYEHQSGARRPPPAASGKRSRAPRRQRVQRIEIE